MGLAATVPPGVRLPPQRVLHLVELHARHRDGRLPFLLEAGLEVERHQEVLADEQSSAQARHAAQVLQVAPQEDGALALLAAVAVHGKHVDVHSRGVGDMLGHGLLEGRGQIEALTEISHSVRIKLKSNVCKYHWFSVEVHTCESLSLSQPEPMMNATSCPSSNQPRESSGH